MEPDTPEPLVFIKEDDFQELLTLVRTLRLASGVTILFAQCNSAEYRNKLIEQARQLYGGWIAETRIPQEVDHLLDYLVKAVPEYADAIFILGIEDWLPSGTVGETSRFVATLNSTRDHFPKRIHCPIVFWGPSHILTTLFRGAPDFFSAVSAIYTFSHGGERHAPQATTIVPNYEAALRESELSTLLAEHDSLPSEQQDEATRAVLLLGIGKARRDAGQYLDAEIPLQEALEIAERKFGLNHAETALAVNELGVLYWLQDKYLEAESFYIRALSISETSLGADHPKTAENLNNLALLYASQSRWVEAEPLFIRALDINERTLGANHPDTATSINNLAYFYQLQGRYIEAEPLYRRALRIEELTLGTDHPGTALSLNNLAALYEAQGKYAEAESLYIRSLDIRQQKLGPDHPGTATSLNNLAYLYEFQGRYVEAEMLYIRALEIRRRVLGDSHPFTRQTIHNLNELYRRQNRYDMLS